MSPAKYLHREEGMENGWFMVSNATFNKFSAISWRSILLVEETRVAGENY